MGDTISSSSVWLHNSAALHGDRKCERAKDREGGRKEAMKDGRQRKKGVRTDERAATEPALATQSLTGLFIVQRDASSLSHNCTFFPFSCTFAFSGPERVRDRVCLRERMQGSYL